MGDAIARVGKRGLKYLDNNHILKRIGRWLGNNIIWPVADSVEDITAPIVNQIKNAIKRKLDEAQEIARQLGEGVDNVIDDVTGRPQLATEGVSNVDRGRIRTPESPQKVEPLQMSGFSASAGKITLTTGDKFKKHFLSKKKLLGDFLGTSYPKFKADSPRFLQDIAKIIDNGTVEFVGLGTYKKGIAPANIYRGNGLTVIAKPDGEWVTLLKTGEGMDLGIRLLN